MANFTFVHDPAAVARRKCLDSGFGDLFSSRMQQRRLAEQHRFAEKRNRCPIVQQERGPAVTQDKTTTPHRKQVTLAAVNNNKKSTYRFWSIKHLSVRDGTLLCNAGPEWYGYHGTFGTLVSTWAPAVGRPSESAGRLAARKKKSGKKDGILNVVCTSGSSRQTRNRTLRRAACHWSHTRISDFASIPMVILYFDLKEFPRVRSDVKRSICTADRPTSTVRRQIVKRREKSFVTF